MLGKRCEHAEGEEEEKKKGGGGGRRREEESASRETMCFISKE